MSDQGLSRRQASRILLAGGLSAAAVAASAGAALAQPVIPKKKDKDNKPPTQPKSPGSATPAQPAPPSFIDEVIKRGRTHDWILKPTVHLQAFQEDTAKAPKDRPLNIYSIKFTTAAILFPVLRATASSQTDVEEVKSELTFNDRVEDVKPEYNESYHSAARLGRWELRDKDGKEIDLKLEIPMTCWETLYDEKAALKATWPATGKWPPAAQSTLGPQKKIDEDPNDLQALKTLLATWTDNKDPKSVPPVMLAKTLAAKVIETFQPSGNGEDYDEHGQFTGLLLQGPKATIDKRAGSPHDIASVLLGLYRAAGLPSRLVIGYDQTDQKGDKSVPFAKQHTNGFDLRTWVEFCITDDASKGEAWIPVDPVRIRRSSSKAPRLEQPWKYFGAHDELDTILPFAFHFIPPTTVVAPGPAYSFWGWFTTPTIPNAVHWLRFQSQTAPRRPKPKEDPRQPPRK